MTLAVTILPERFGPCGCRGIYSLLRAEPWRVNHKRVERPWRREVLKTPKKYGPYGDGAG